MLNIFIVLSMGKRLGLLCFYCVMLFGLVICCGKIELGIVVIVSMSSRISVVCIEVS